MTHPMFNGINSFNPCLLNSFKADPKLMNSFYSSQLAAAAGSFKPPTSSLNIASNPSPDSSSTMSAADGYRKQLMSQLAMLTPGMSSMQYGIGGFNPGKRIKSSNL